MITYHCVDINDQEKNRRVREVMDMLNIPDSDARKALNACAWNVQDAIEYHFNQPQGGGGA